MKSLTAQAHDGWSHPLIIPTIQRPGDYTVRPGTRWSHACGTWKRMPYQTFPLITTYVRGALPYFEHEKLIGTRHAIAPLPDGGIGSLPRADVKARAGNGTTSGRMIKEATDTCMVPRALTKTADCEETKYIPKMEVRTVQRTIEVASKTEKRFVPREVPVDTPFIVPRFEDREVPVVVSNTISPEIEETETVVEVPVARYVPHLVPINVYVPRAVAIPVVLTGESKQEAPAALPKESLQQLMKQLNPHLEEIEKFNASQGTKFQELLEKSQKAANFAKCPVPVPRSTPLLKITEVEPEGEESDHLVKQICFSTGGYHATEVESLFTALTATTTTTGSEGDATPAHKEMTAEQQDSDTHDDTLSAATGVSNSQRRASVVSGKDVMEGVPTTENEKAASSTEERKDNESKTDREGVDEAK